DDPGTLANIEYRGFGHHGRVGPGNLYRNGLALAVVIQATGGFDAVPQAGIAGGHFRHGMTGPQPSTQLAERPVGDACHGRDNHLVWKQPGTYAHENGRAAVRKARRRSNEEIWGQAWIVPPRVASATHRTSSVTFAEST